MRKIETEIQGDVTIALYIHSLATTIVSVCGLLSPGHSNLAVLLDKSENESENWII